MDVNRQVSELRVVLAVQEIELKKKNEIADKILAEVRAENTKAEAEKAIGKALLFMLNCLKFVFVNSLILIIILRIFI